MDEARALAKKAGGKETGIPDELPEDRPRRTRFMGLFLALPLLSTATFVAAGALPLSVLVVPGFLGCVLVLSLAYVTGFAATLFLDTTLKVVDWICWPLLRGLGHVLAGLMGGNRQQTYFPSDADHDSFWDQQRYQGLIPDREWVPSVGALAFSYAVFVFGILTNVSGWALDPLSAMVLLAAWGLACYGIGRQAVRTLLLQHRFVHGLYWAGLEALAVARRSGRRLFYLTQPVLRLEDGVASDAVRCPYCSDPIGDMPSVACETCHTPHHQDCWGAFGRCTVYACPGEVGRTLG